MAIVLDSSITPEGASVQTLGSVMAVVGTLVFSGSYATGGVVISEPDLPSLFSRLGNGDVYYVEIPSVAGYSFEYDYATDKILVRQGDNDNAADAPAAQLPVAAFPAAITGSTNIRLFALGR